MNLPEVLRKRALFFRNRKYFLNIKFSSTISSLISSFRMKNYEFDTSGGEVPFSKHFKHIVKLFKDHKEVKEEQLTSTFCLQVDSSKFYLYSDTPEQDQPAKVRLTISIFFLRF